MKYVTSYFAYSFFFLALLAFGWKLGEFNDGRFLMSNFDTTEVEVSTEAPEEPPTSEEPVEEPVVETEEVVSLEDEEEEEIEEEDVEDESEQADENSEEEATSDEDLEGATTRDEDPEEDTSDEVDDGDQTPAPEETVVEGTTDTEEEDVQEISDDPWAQESDTQDTATEEEAEDTDESTSDNPNPDEETEEEDIVDEEPLSDIEALENMERLSDYEMEILRVTELNDVDPSDIEDTTTEQERPRGSDVSVDTDSTPTPEESIGEWDLPVAKSNARFKLESETSKERIWEYRVLRRDTVEGIIWYFRDEHGEEYIRDYISLQDQDRDVMYIRDEDLPDLETIYLVYVLQEEIDWPTFDDRIESLLDELGASIDREEKWRELQEKFRQNNR